MGIGAMPTNDSSAGFEQRPFDGEPVDRVGPVEHDHGHAMFPGRTQRVIQRADEGVEADADVLHVENQDIHPGQHRGGRLARRAVEAVDRDARLRVEIIGHGCAVGGCAGKPMLHAEERDHLHAGRLQRVERRGEIRQHGRRMGDQPDPPVPNQREAVVDETIQSGLYHVVHFRSWS